jgi:hypothetical protein
LAYREQFFNELEANAVRSDHPAERQVFLRNLRRRRPEPGLDRKMLFLLADRQKSASSSTRRRCVRDSTGRSTSKN